MAGALVIVDMQGFVADRIGRGIEAHPADAIENMKTLLAHARRGGETVVHVRHQTSAEGSLLHKDAPLAQPADGFEAAAGEPVFIKNTSSAFSSTGLLSYLRERKMSACTVIGAVAGFCVNSTVRSGADAGLSMTVVSDAVLSFALEEAGQGARQILDVTLALLAADFATVLTTTELLAASGER